MYRVYEHVTPQGNAAFSYDEAHELVHLLFRLRARSRRVEDLLAYDRALHIVRAEVQRDLREREPHHDPVGLDVRNVVEQQARHRDQLQVVRAGRVPPAAPLEDRVLRMEGERDEREETAGL